MKDVPKKDQPEVSGGLISVPVFPEPTLPIRPYPTDPCTPVIDPLGDRKVQS